MKTKLFIFSALLFIFSLAACTAPPEPDSVAQNNEQESAVEQIAEATSGSGGALSEAETEVVVVEVTAEAPPPTPEPIPQDYPTPEAIVPVQVIESYPEPETAQAVAEAGYPEPAADIVPILRDVMIPMRGEFTIYGTLSTNGGGAQQPGVLLLHMLGGERSDWAATGFDRQLNQQGYATLAIDLRGHGQSGSDVDWALAEEDLLSVWEWFTSQPEIDPANSMIIGASIGSNLALRTATNAPSVKAVVMLSPGLNYREVTTDDAIAAFDRPVLLVAMDADGYAADSVIQLNELNATQTTAEISEGSAHGTRMFGAYPGLEGLILDFLAASQS